MSIKKKLLAVAAVSALSAATAVPALALENEFHGMFKFFGYESNFFNGLGANLNKDVHSGFFAEQRARIQYIAKANDNLKLVTHFELDSRFGGKTTPSGPYFANDAGNIDADQITLETKNVYLDFNCPITGTNVKAGIQPWADAYKSVFLLADMTGVIASKKFDPLTVSLGWFRFDDNTPTASTTPGDLTADLIVLDGKFAVNKNINVGASYYNIQRDTTTGLGNIDQVELLHMIGLNASVKAGPATIDPFVAFQYGETNEAKDAELNAFLAGATAKVKVGPGNVNLAALYLSGDDDGNANQNAQDFKIVGVNQSYFNAANMWLLIRSGQGVNTSTSVLGNNITVGGRGLVGVFAGYDGTMDKLFYNANVGYMRTAEERTTTLGPLRIKEDGTIGTEINAQVGYKLYDNLSVSVAGAYAILGEGMHSGAVGKKISGFGAVAAENPYMTNVQLAYAF
ncbi:MAG: porin [Geobacteraceae bacterium]|nr:porin [Geobacteraceae bacterium]